jgi:hypothetical protein
MVIKNVDVCCDLVGISFFRWTLKTYNCGIFKGILGIGFLQEIMGSIMGL